MPARSTNHELPDVTILRDGQRLFVEPGHQDVLQSLTASRYRANEDPEHGYLLQRVPEPLCSVYESVPGQSRLCAPAGLFALIRQLLVGAGYRVHSRCLINGTMPRELPPAPPGLDLRDRWLANAVGEHHHLLIRYGQDVSPMRLIAQIARRHPDARIAVLTHRYAETYATCHRLRRCGIEVEPVTPRHCPARVSRVLSATYSALSHESVDYPHIDIVIALDAIEALGEQARAVLE